MRKSIILSMLASAAFAAQPALATPLPDATPQPCSVNDISPTESPFTMFSDFDCSGYVKGNAFNSSGASQTLLQGLLDDLFGAGVKDATTITFTKYSGLNGANSEDFSNPPFSTLLNGTTLIGFHFGAGNDSPGAALDSDHKNVDSSGLYLFDAGTNLQTLYWSYGASSDIVLFSTQPPVPEPASWALLITGFVVVGAALRRRRVAVSFA